MRDLLPGTYLLEDFRIVGAPFQGGQGRVYLLRRSKAGPLDPNLVCAKCLRPELADDLLRTVFQEECQTWLSLGDYDHIVKAFSFRRIYDEPFILMEHAPYGSLESSLRSLVSANSDYVSGLAKLSDDVQRRQLYLRLCTLLGIARGMLFFHSRTGRVHCDLKPSNVLISKPETGRVILPEGSIRDAEDGAIRIEALVPQGVNLARLGLWLTKVSDFGFSRAVGDSSLGCTPPYAAPEQLQRHGEVDPRTDVYGFGATAYFVLFDQAPSRTAWVDPERGTTGVPQTMLDLLRSCLALDKSSRPAGFLEIAMLLSRCIEQEFGVSVPEPWDPKTVESDLLAPLLELPDIARVEIQSVATDEVSLLSFGDNLFLCGSPERALRFYRQVLDGRDQKGAPDELDALTRRLCHERIGLCHLLLGDQSLATRHFEQGLFPDSAQRVGAGSVAERGMAVEKALGHRIFALVYLRAASHLAAGDPEIHYNIAITERGLGNFRQAEQEVRRALACLAAPGARERLSSAAERDYHAVLGNCLRKTGDLQEAVAAYREAYRLDPADSTLAEIIAGIERDLAGDTPDALTRRGCALLEAGRLAEALECFEAALVLNADHEQAWYNKGLACGGLRRYQEEIHCYERAISINPAYERAWFNLGAAWAQVGNATQSAQCFGRLVMLNPADLEGWLGRATALANLGQSQDALSALDEALRRDSENGAAWLLRGIVLRSHSGDEVQARECFEKALHFGRMEAAAFLK